MRFAKRPWGWWFVLLGRKHFKVKLLFFKNGGQLSMQRHKHRSELWLFLSGYGITHDSANEKAPKGIGFKNCYRLFNAGTWHQYTAQKATWVLEIQYGEKCKETDIERL